MPWIVEFDGEFKGEFKAYDDEVKSEIRALVEILKQLGPEYGRPRVDTLESKKHSNLKELRFSAADGEWRLLLTRNEKPFFWLVGISLG